MRTFHELVFDEVLVGTDVAYTSPAFDDLLGLAESLTISGYAARATGTSPRLTVSVEDSPDHMHWRERAAPVNSASLDTTQDTDFGGGEGGVGPYSTPRQAFARLKIYLGGTSPMARIVIWVTGRAEEVVRNVAVVRSTSASRAAQAAQPSARAQLASQGVSALPSATPAQFVTGSAAQSQLAVPQLLPSALSPDGVPTVEQHAKRGT